MQSGWRDKACILAGSAIGWLSLSCAAAPIPATPIPAAQVPQISPLPHIMPRPAPNLGEALPNFRALAPESAVPNAAVPVRSVAVAGVTAFTPAETAAVTAGLIGARVKLARIEAARRRLLDLYRAHGFVLTAVSAELDAAGNLRFLVTEGHIVAVKLSRDIGPAGTMVLRFLDHLTHQRPVRQQSLERWLLLAEQIPGVDVHAVLEPNAADPGALTLIAEVAKQAVSGILTADNRAFRDTGPAEGLAVADLNSVTQFGDQTEISLFHAAGGTETFGQASESFFIGADGLRLKLYGGTGRTQPRGPLALIGYHSTITVFGGEFSYPLILRRGEALTGKLRLDATENLIDTVVQGVKARNSADSVRAVRFLLDDAFSDDVLRGDRVGLTTAELAVSKGIPALGASANNRAVDAGRLGETFTFWKLDASLARTQTLFSPWANATVAVRGAAGGQFTNDVLPSSEEFYLGGTSFTQGYYAGEVVGDKALYASAELQLNTDHAFRIFGRHDFGTQYYAFYDWGEAWDNQGPHTLSDRRLASAGFGVRMGFTRYLELDFEAVHRLTTRLSSLPGVVPPLSASAVYWGIVARY